MSNSIVILSGDIGGTKTRLGLYVLTSNQQKTIVEEVYQSKNYSEFECLISNFMGKYPNYRIDAACFGLAGPVIEGVCKTTNLPWTIEVYKLQELLDCEYVSLINDMQAQATGVLALNSKDLITLTSTSTLPKTGNKGIIAAGTGLGESLLYWDGCTFKAVASEGGAVEFAPRNKLQIELLDYLLQRFNHVSYEKLLSGQGILNIYSFLKDTGYDNEPYWLKDLLEASDNPPATISDIALARKNSLCEKTIDIFVSIYGSEAGNVALRFMTLGGVYIGGGIAYKIAKKFTSGGFVSSFCDKGTFSGLMESIPIYIISDPNVGLWGALLQAKTLVNNQ